MPIPDQRDPDVTRHRLADWLATRPDVSDVWVSPVGGPAATGFSNETILFDARWLERGEKQERSLVARVQPTSFAVFLESEFETQFRVMKALADNTDVPMPAIHWYEPDAAFLGAPFWVMDRVEGQVPGDNPSYAVEGWLAESTPQDQARLWWSGVDALARVHRCDWKELGLDLLDKPHRGKKGLDQQLDYYREYLAWAERGRPNVVAEAALDWLESNRPDDDTAELCWGDSRIGNQIFRDYECQAVLDWEMVTLGDPVQDLAWWLFIDRHNSEGWEVPRLPGFPTREETVERWEELTGRKAEHLDYYEVFGGFRFSVIMMRIAEMLIDYELMPPDSDMETNNIPSRMLASMLRLPPPG